ncbi:hypothetical protein V8E51_007442 [Hyaloscypha variabilis]
MTVPFGFSIGDFVTGIGLIRDVIECLQASSSSTARYQSLMSELFTLERALLEVKKLAIGDEQTTPPERLALEALHGALRLAAVQCQDTISRLLGKVKKYDRHLSKNGSGSKWKDALRKVQWAILTDKDLEESRAEIRGHATSITMLLTVTQLETMRLQSQKSRNDQMSIVRPPSFRFTEYEEPIVFVDAFGKQTRFHPDFVYSPAILESWLKHRFKEVGYEKILNGEYALEDMKTKRQINFSRDWQTQLYPGMCLGMDMIYKRHQDQLNSCPGCQLEYLGTADENIECANCGVHFRRIDELLELESNPDNFINTTEAPIALSNLSQPCQQGLQIKPTSPSHKYESPVEVYIKRLYREREQMRLFRRFRFQPTRVESELSMLPPLYLWLVVSSKAEEGSNTGVEYEAAEELYGQMLMRLEGNNNRRQPNILYGLYNLGIISMYYGKLKDAEETFLRILEEIGGSLRPEDSGLLSRTFSGLACVKWMQGKNREAEILLRQDLHNRGQYLAGRDAEAIAVYNNLAMTLKKQGEAREALDIQQRVVAYVSELWGIEDPDVKEVQETLEWIKG